MLRARNLMGTSASKSPPQAILVTVSLIFFCSFQEWQFGQGSPGRSPSAALQGSPMQGGKNTWRGHHGNAACCEVYRTAGIYFLDSLQDAVALTADGPSVAKVSLQALAPMDCEAQAVRDFVVQSGSHFPFATYAPLSRELRAQSSASRREGSPRPHMQTERS